MDFNERMIIETDRLILRYMSPSDKHDIFVNINNDKDVLEYFIDTYLEDEENSKLEKTINFCLESKRYFFAIVLKDTNEAIGMMLQCNNSNQVFNTIEVGYAIGKKYWNQGYTTEALNAFIKFLFTLGIHKVMASHFLPNIASKRVMEKCGMVYQGIVKEEVYYHNQYHDLVYYYILNPNDK